MKGLARVLFYLAIIGFVATITFNLTHRPALGAIIFLSSCFLVFNGMIISMFSSPKYSIGRSPLIFRLEVLLNTFAFESAIFWVSGLILRFANIGGSLYLLAIGTLLMLFFLVVLCIKIIVRYRK